MFRDGDGWRHGWLGLSGVGKSYAAIASLRWALDNRAADCVLVLDTKGRRAQYPGAYRLNVGQLRTDPPAPDEDAGQIVFRGCAARIVIPGTHEVLDCTAEEVAAYAWELALSAETPRVIVMLDELAKAVRPNSVMWQGDQLRRLFSEGRSSGLSVMWTTQILARCPTEAIDLSDTVGIFQLAGRSLDYVSEVLRIRSREVVSVIERLDRGEFIVWDNETGWDGRVWRFPAGLA